MGALRVRALLELLVPHLLTKRLQALALLAYIYSRHLSLQGHASRYHHDGKGRFTKGSVTPLTEQEKELLNYIRYLNRTGFQILNEHMLDSAPDVEMMCSELHRKYAEVAEMTARLEMG